METKLTEMEIEKWRIKRKIIDMDLVQDELKLYLNKRSILFREFVKIDNELYCHISKGLLYINELDKIKEIALLYNFIFVSVYPFNDEELILYFKYKNYDVKV